MVAPPADVERGPLLRQRLLAHARESLVALPARDGREAVEHVCEEEAHPDARADLEPPEHVDAVIPVAGPEQRQAVLADVLEA